MLKKIRLFVLGFFLITATKAICFDTWEDSVCTDCSPCPRYYIEGDLGYAFSDWTTTINHLFPAQTDSYSAVNIRKFSNKRHGFCWGGDVGYRLNRDFAIEVGAFSLPTVRYNIRSGTEDSVTQDKGKFHHWLVYFAGKVIFPVPLLQGLDLFGKFGIAYRAGKITDNETTSNETTSGEVNAKNLTGYFKILQPILGAGAQYYITKSWSINAQYLFAPYGDINSIDLGPNEVNHHNIPAAHLVTGGIGFHF
jgi:opacity protein-like surface antigen